jgi:hypothetical protein
MALALAAVGCGSSGKSPGTGSGGGGAGTSGHGGTITWVDDGAPQTADFVSLTRSTKSGFDQLVGVGTKTNVGLTFKVVVPTDTDGGAIQTGVDYPCDGAYIVFVYQVGPTASHTTQSCTINVSALGSATTPTSGTFSATLKDSTDAVKQITAGTFSGIPTISN